MCANPRLSLDAKIDKFTKIHASKLYISTTTGDLSPKFKLCLNPIDIYNSTNFEPILLTSYLPAKLC